MAIKDPDGLRVAGVVGTIWNTIMCFGAIMIGVSARALSFSDPRLVVEKADTIFPTVANLYLHPVVAGIVLAAVFAAIMSTADSQLLVAASGVVRARASERPR